MAITSEIIGKLGGAGAEVIPVEGEASGPRDSTEVIATIDVPAGETWLVAAIGQLAVGASGPSQLPALHLGDVQTPRASSGTHGLATTATESISLSIERRTNSGSDTFTGHVYAVKL